MVITLSGNETNNSNFKSGSDNTSSLEITPSQPHNSCVPRWDWYIFSDVMQHNVAWKSSHCIANRCYGSKSTVTDVLESGIISHPYLIIHIYKPAVVTESLCIAFVNMIVKPDGLIKFLMKKGNCYQVKGATNQLFYFASTEDCNITGTVKFLIFDWD